MFRTAGLVTIAVILASGCKSASPTVTAVPLSAWNRDEPEGIPFYLPKPLLIVAKNFRYVEEAKVGLTASPPIPNYFDDQAKYADLNARTNFQQIQSTGPPAAITGGTTNVTFGGADAAAVAEPVLHSKGPPIAPGEAPADGLTPETFYTYQIVFVPDLTQKYGLRIKGGVGEIRAAMNLVNGWQFTGLGPYYMKDSSTAQNTLASGIAASLAASGVADVVSEVAGLAEQLGRGGVGAPTGRSVTEAQVQELFQPLQGLRPLDRLEGYAEIHVFEPQMNPLDGSVCWVPVTELSFYREYLGLKTKQTTATTTIEPPPDVPGTRGILVPAATGRGPGAIPRAPGEGVPPGSLINVNQHCAPGACPPPPPEPKHHGWLNPLNWLGHHQQERPEIRTAIREQVIDGGGPAFDAGVVFVPDATDTDSGDADSSDDRPMD